jgi:hypothetical protein
MFIIPYIYKIKTQNNIKSHIIQILTIGGNELWEEASSLDIQTDILIPNSLYSTSTPFTQLKGQNIYMCEIDTDKTTLSDFYNWNEINISDSDTFCWRTFMYITDLNNNIWLPIPKSEKLSNFRIKDLIDAVLSSNKCPTKG